MNSLPLFASVLLSLLVWSAAAAELKSNDLCSVEATYLKSESESGITETIHAPLEHASSPDFDFIDEYNQSLFSIGELNVERKITVDASGAEVHSDTFNVGLHIAINYTP